MSLNCFHPFAIIPLGFRQTKYGISVNPFQTGLKFYERISYMKKRIPIFFASDDNYVPFLSVTAKSIELHADKENIYDIKVLSGGLNERSVSLLSRLNSEYINIEIINIEEII